MWRCQYCGGRAPTFVNTLTVVNHGDALMVAIAADAELQFALSDTAQAGMVSAALEPGFPFVGFTGEDDTSLAVLLAPLADSVTAAFIFDPVTQEWLAFRRFAPSFVSQVTMIGRLEGMFVLNEGLMRTDITWFNPQPEPPNPDGIGVVIEG